MKPLVSIIIPYYHGQIFITETLESLFQQDYKNIEIILVDDGSSPESLLVLIPYQNCITIIHQENKGVATARNTGIRHAKGSIIGFIDQDDLWSSNHISQLLPYLMNEHYGFVRGHTVAFELRPDGTRASSDSVFLPVLLGAALYTRQTIDTVGFLDETMLQGDDFDWNVRLDETGIPWKEIPETVLFYRKHGNNHSLTADAYVKKGILLTIRKKLARARQ